MNSLKALNEILTQSAKLLDDASGQIRDIPLEPVRENIVRIGTALTYIHEIQLTIYAIEPSLTPDYLKVKSPHSEENKKFGKLIVEADDLCNAGHFEKAIELYENYISNKPPSKFIQMAMIQIDEIKKQKSL